MKWIALAVLALLAAAPAAAQPPASSPGALPPTTDYSADGTWLCLPGREDICSRPLGSVELNRTGYGAVTESRPAADPGVDCFYVYPTVSLDSGLNSDMTPGFEEQAAAMVQFARFSTVCRPFAPIYRQLTLAAINRQSEPGWGVAALVAYRDVRDAWHDFLAHRSHDRPFVLIGHSQGAALLLQLLAREIDGQPIARRMVAAYLIGFNVEVPQGRVVGGTFQHIPLCTRAGETGCVVTYVSFRDTAPPLAGAMFGQAATAGMTVGCVNPAALGSTAAAPLDSYWFNSPSRTANIQWSSAGPPPTPFLHTRDLVSGQCVNRGSTGYLAVHVNADPVDPRTDDIPGDVVVAGVRQPGWGIHLVDMNHDQGDLVRLVAAQAAAMRH